MYAEGPGGGGTLPSDLLDLFGYRPAWWADAACREPQPGATWFPERGEDTAPAKAVCRRCLVRSECLEFALEHGEKHGVWGGTSERERRARRTAS